MACYFNYFVDSVECSNDNVILKNHAEKEIQIVFTERLTGRTGFGAKRPGFVYNSQTMSMKVL